MTYTDKFYVDSKGDFLDGLVQDIKERQEARELDVYLSDLANDIEREVDEMLNDKTIRIGFKRLSDDAILPTKAHPTDSGYDLYAAEDVIIEPGDTAIVKTGIAVELPPGYEAQIRPRSGVTSKTKLRVQLGTIDQDYRGEIGVIVDNIHPLKQAVKHIQFTDGDIATTEVLNGGVSIKIRKGERIAQLVVQALPEVSAVEIDDFTEDSERGEGGFGSSGV